MPRCPPVDVRASCQWRSKRKGLMRRSGRASGPGRPLSRAAERGCRCGKSETVEDGREQLCGKVIEKSPVAGRLPKDRRKKPAKSPLNWHPYEGLGGLSAREIWCSRGRHEAPVGVRKGNAKKLPAWRTLSLPKKGEKKIGRSRPPSRNCVQRPQSREPRVCCGHGPATTK